MAILSLEIGMSAEFTWWTNMSGNQILKGNLVNEEGETVKSLSWEMIDDDRPIAEIEQEMLEELLK